MAKNTFIEKFESLNDRERFEWLINDYDGIVPFTINIDNDDVFINFDDEVDMDDPTILSFDEFGYELLPDLFKAVGLKGELV